jgi:hypothetical protein
MSVTNFTNEIMNNLGNKFGLQLSSNDEATVNDLAHDLYSQYGDTKLTEAEFESVIGRIMTLKSKRSKERGQKGLPTSISLYGRESVTRRSNQGIILPNFDITDKVQLSAVYSESGRVVMRGTNTSFAATVGQLKNLLIGEDFPHVPVFSHPGVNTTYTINKDSWVAYEGINWVSRTVSAFCISLFARGEDNAGITTITISGFSPLIGTYNRSFDLSFPLSSDIETQFILFITNSNNANASVLTPLQVAYKPDDALTQVEETDSYYYTGTENYLTISFSNLSNVVATVTPICPSVDDQARALYKKALKSVISAEI